MDRVRVLRLVKYEEPKDLVEQQIKKSEAWTRDGHEHVRISAVTFTIYPAPEWGDGNV
jgi:hypothetical protein